MSSASNNPFDLLPSKTWYRSHHAFLLFAVLAVAAAGGFWYWNQWTKIEYITLSSGVECRYREGILTCFCDEAKQRDLIIDSKQNYRSADAIGQVDRHEVDAAIVPASLAVAAENVRQVAFLDCEALHLFVRPEIAAQGIGGLRGRRVNMGVEGSGCREMAKEICNFAGMKPTADFIDDKTGYRDLMTLPSADLPDAIFSLTPLPSPLGERVASKCGFVLMELPMGPSLALRKPDIEDTTIPPDTYSADPPVPVRLLHTVGTRSVLIANKDVSVTAIERILIVLYESEYSSRAGIKPLDPALLARNGAYMAHPGARAYQHRNDPWINQTLVNQVKGLFGTIISSFSALWLAWQWLVRKEADYGEYFRECNRLDLEAHRAAMLGRYGENELSDTLMQVAKLKSDILERHQDKLLSADKQVAELVGRIEALQQTLPTLVRTSRAADRIALAFPTARPRKVG
jgi:TRAP-type uncharacterized transport system substrate-binding protein